MVLGSSRGRTPCVQIGDINLNLKPGTDLRSGTAVAEYTRFDGDQIGRINLRPYGCFMRKDHWYYIFYFPPVVDGNAVHGGGYFAAVLMDGTIISPEAMGNPI